MKNKSLFILTLSLTLGFTSGLMASANFSYAEKTASVTQICSFNVTDSKKSSAATDLKALDDSSSSFQVHDYFDSKKDGNLEHSFEAFLQSQIDSDRHCDGLAITGYYGEQPIIEGDEKTNGPLDLNAIKKVLSHSKMQNWAKGVKAVYFDGAFTSPAQTTLNTSFPNAQFIGSPYNVPRDNVSWEHSIRTMMAQAFLKASAGGNIGSEQEELQIAYESLKGAQPYAQSYDEKASLSAITSVMGDAAKKLEAMTSPGVLFKAPQGYNLMPARADDPSAFVGPNPQTAGVQDNAGAMQGPKPASQ